jgi:hypothetical protein
LYRISGGPNVNECSTSFEFNAKSREKKGGVMAAGKLLEKELLIVI